MLKPKLLILFLLICNTSLLYAQKSPEGPYPTDPAAEKQKGVPEGKLVRGTFSDSKIFPGTERKYAIYVPHQYKSSRAACLMVVQDGLKFIREKGDWKLPIVFDNLIHSGEMPVTIGLFVEPGIVPASNDDALPRYNRSFEYDAIDDRYARFLLNEMLPLVEKDYRISKLPDDWAICGSSSGGIAAFNVAWQRPDKFRRVCTAVGTYIGLRGAHEMSTMVRKAEPKPLRVFLQDGSNDLNIYCGDWWVANQGMLSALEFSGYEVNHVWGEGGHNGKHGAAVFPEAMRWLWKDWPKAVQTHIQQNRSKAREMLIEGQGWELVSKDKQFLGAVATDNNGNVFYADRLAEKIYKLDSDENETLFWPKENDQTPDADDSFDSVKINGIAVGTEGQVYVSLFAQGKVVELDSGGKIASTLKSNIKPSGVVAAHDGTVYFTDVQTRSVWMKTPDDPCKVAGKGFAGLTGIALSPDQSLVLVSDFAGRYVWSSQRAQDGTLRHIQPYFHIHFSPASVDVRARSEGMCVANSGWLLVATGLGVQVCDQAGRVNFIIGSPNNGRYPTDVTFGGPDGQTLYAVCGGRMFKRKLKLIGAQPWDTPVKPPKPRL